MTPSRLRWATGLAAILAAACFSAQPAAAATSCSGKQCAAAKMKNKVAKQPRVHRHARVRTQNRRVAAVGSRPGIWQGWGGSFYLYGERFPGGNPVGPAAWYNNWEGGFHPTVYWRLRDANIN